MICVSLALLMAAHPRASAATITVDGTADDLDQGPNGNCTLREAIIAANTDAAVDGCAAGNGADTIVLAAETYALTIPLPPGTSDTAEVRDLDVASDLTIQGAGLQLTSLDARRGSRVLDIAQGGYVVTITDATIANGVAEPSRVTSFLRPGAVFGIATARSPSGALPSWITRQRTRQEARPGRDMGARSRRSGAASIYRR